MCNNHNTREFDNTIELAGNAMLKVRPDLFYEWDFEKNDELGLDIYKVTKGSEKITWWNCTDCGSSYDTPINRRNNGSGCPYCSGQKVNHTNSLASLNPELASEWHPTLNGALTPHDVTCKSNRKVWWICKKHKNHKWESIISNRNNKNYGCPYCSNKKVLKGFNDMWTTNPELAKLLANPDGGYKYTYGSKRKINWKCPDCGGIIKNKTIHQISYYGLYCPQCSDGKSYPEKVMYNFLKYLNIEFELEKSFEWSKNKRYDFYLPNYNILIEINGIQHYELGFKNIGGRSLKEEIKNDNIKEKLAKDNGINRYIVIDARYSNIEYIKINIIQSKLSKYFDFSNINWELINKESLTSLALKTIELWNNNYRVTDISNELKICADTVREYLKKGMKSGLCNYDTKEQLKICGNLTSKLKICIQLSLNGFYIKEWESIIKAEKELNIKNISSCCRGRRKTAGGYKWMYKEDYDKLIHNQEVC